MMEPSEEERPPRSSLEFAESSILDTLVPLEEAVDMEQALSGSVQRLDDHHDSPLASIAQRQSLFFDETATVFVVLQTPYFDERSLRSYLGRLAITLEVQVVNTTAESYEGPPPQETIFTGAIQDNEDPVIVVQDPDESGGEGHILVVWKVLAFLARPRLRLQNPSVVFSASANLKPLEQIQSDALIQEYLPSQIPSGVNLLEAFSDDPALGGVKPHLSALRVSRVAPATQTTRDMMRPFKNISRRSMKIFPAINARIKYSRPSTTPTNPSIIASLDVDITSYTNCNMTLKKVEMKIMGGHVENLNGIKGLLLPIECSPQDDVTFLYRIIPDDMDIANKSQIRVLEVSVEACADVVKDLCQPLVSMQWTTALDFTPPVNPGFGTPTQPIVRQHRPSQLSLNSSFDTIPTVSSLSINRPDALPAVELTTRHERSSSIPDFGVTMTFIGPPLEDPIHAGIPFSWSVFIVNRSDRSRKLALMVLPTRHRSDARVMRPPSTSYGGVHKDIKVADAVVDENIVHAMQRNAALESAEVICLNTDIRVGPLAPSACHMVDMTFIALKDGFVEIEAIRVVDLGTQEHVDIKDLPSIIVSPQGES
ncbi:hypothetical protein PVAG01_01562 [Phlyctema vagabunda]|uniref:Trafficking protein particle complex II-specific subunit 65 IgD3 domain-containing protein n=1 Tax=Phlyctema vagabunda TaxID=108571 RepID=A0ABR4PXF5_9HELO